MKLWLFLLMGLVFSNQAHAFELGPDGQAAQDMLENIVSRNDARILEVSDKKMGSPEAILKGIGEIRAFLKNPAASRQYFSETRTVFTTMNEGKSYRGQLRVEQSDGQSYLLDYHCKDSDGKILFDAFHLTPVTEEQKANAQFHFGGRDLGDYLMMLAGLLIAIFSIYSAVMVRKSGVKRKILWTLACLVSAVTFSVTWTPYDDFWGVPIPSVKIFQFLFLGVSFARLGTYNPYVLSVAIPVGAMLFWYKNYKANSKLLKGNKP